MITNAIAVHALARYYRAHKDGQLLGNEPARLLCEYLDEQLSPSVVEPFEQHIEALLGDVDLEQLSDVNTLGGIRVTGGRVLSLAHYDRGEGFYPLTLSQLLELAKMADGSGESAPIPAWHDDMWAPPLFEVEQALGLLNFRETVKILAANNVPMCIRDGVPTFEAGGLWFDEPHEALTALLESGPAQRRVEILRNL